MAKRVFELAKELSVQSKAIVEKCHAEGIPADVIKNHMSTVSVGLEATIRDWFGEGGGTAVETATKVDLKKVRAKSKAKAAKRIDAPPADAPAQTGTDTGAETPAQAQPAPDEPPADEPRAEPVVRREPPADEPARPAASTPDPEPVQAPKARPSTAPAARAPGQDESPEARPAERPAPGRDGDRDEDSSKFVPAPQNVPNRPTQVSPAGPQLEKRQAVKLSGPRVVRVEAPEPVAPPRPRRAPPGGPGGPPMMPDGPGRRGPGAAGGGGAGGAGGRNNRRGPGGGGVPDRRRGRAGGKEGGSGAWSEQDLAEREARLQRSGGYLKARRQQLRRQMQHDRPQTPAEQGGKVEIQAPFTIKDLSAATGVKAADIIKHLFMQGVMATPNAILDSEKAEEVMLEYNIELVVKAAKSAEDVVSQDFEERQLVDERPRGPVVTILGHVDHGKTSLLDRIRSANVAAGEAGGITQATSAFRVPVKIGDNDREVVFLDTPGHEAFTSMRARGAHVTDIVVLVVAADDGVMPQTIESINHAKAAGVPIVVALNKIDKPEATDSNVQRILGQLAEHGLNPADWGGDTEVMKTSATTGKGVQELLEVLEYQSELLELKADFGGPARGTVVESRFEQGRGPVANILLQDGELKLGDFIVAGRAFGRVRDITDDRGKKLKKATPPAPMQISGLDELPDAGDKFFVVDTLKKAQEAAEQRRHREREQDLTQPKVTLDSLFSKMAETDLKEILIVLKADVQGSVDVLKNEIEKVATDEVRSRVLHAQVGGITESDVILAEASRAIIVGFNVIPSSKARKLAEQKGVEIRTYKVIYDITDDIRKAAEGLLEPELREEVLGHAEVRAVFKVSKVGSVAGCYVTNGTVERDAFVRITRNDIVIENDRRLSQLKRFKDDAKEVRAGMECGMKIDGYDDIKEGDIIECYKQIKVKRTL
ncbi:MAG: translation initiation factor IF-2 [Phycisphaerales bacterium]|nr:translation initiation factor IF-2 [Phycisphaerales bacterium]